jgi:alkyl hydroperoxide reductase subunit AhpC
MLTVGNRFPTLDLKAVVPTPEGAEIRRVTDEDYAGRWKVVFFWPKDFTFVCPTEIAEFGRRERDFRDRDAQVLGASTDQEFDVGRNVDEVLRVLDALQTGELCPCNWKKGEPTLEAA